jgi:PKD repeat protein
LSICNGSSVTLDANPSGATSYLWSNFATGSSLVVTQPGTYFVTITGANGCSSVSPSVTVTSGSANIPFITPGGPTIICEGQTVTLLSSSPTGNLWNTGETTESIDADTTGNYFVTVTDPNGCSATSAIIQVIVNPLPVASFTFNAQVGGLVSFTNTSTSFVSSQWDFGDGSALSNTTSPVYTYASDGTYNVVLTVYNNCGSSTLTQQVSIIGTGIDELGAGQTFNVYPNPNNGSFTLNYTTTDAENISVQITDATGRLIWMDATQSSSLQYTKQVNLEGVAKGVYFLRLNTGERMITRRVIVD